MTLITDMTERLDEYFAVKSNLIDHYARHVNETGEADPKTLREYPGAMAFKTEEMPDEETYDRLADELARRPLEKSKILGFIAIDGRIQKYNKETKEFTSYNVNTGGDPINITYFPMSLDSWNENKKYGKHRYKEPLTPEKDAKPL